MDKSPKPKGQHGEGQSPYHRKDDGGRGIDDTHPGTSVVSDVKGGTGDQGGDGDPKHRPGAKPSV